MKNKIVDQVLQQKVTRREFLLYLGSTVLAITGVSGFLKNLSKQHPKGHSSFGYGNSTYGGKD
jgi:Trp operon repressor